MKGLLIFLMLGFYHTPSIAVDLSTLPDPTRPDSKQPPVVKPVVKKPKAVKPKKVRKPLFKLEQTIVAPNRKSAVINGKVLSIGEKINGATVISISNNKASLRWRKEIIKLNLISQKGIKEVDR